MENKIMRMMKRVKSISADITSKESDRKYYLKELGEFGCSNITDARRKLVQLGKSKKKLMTERKKVIDQAEKRIEAYEQ